MTARRISKKALRSERTSITLTKTEREWLEKQAAAGGMSLTDYLLDPHRRRMRAEAMGDLVLDRQSADRLLRYLDGLEAKIAALERRLSDEEIADRATRFMALVDRWTKAGRVPRSIEPDVPWKAEDLVAYVNAPTTQPKDREEFLAIYGPILRSNPADAEAFKTCISRLLKEWQERPLSKVARKRRSVPGR